MKRTALKSGPWRKYTQIETGKLKKKLDTLFSALIRERDFGKACIDLCGKDYPVRQAGHFRRRELMMTRWNPKNVNGQNRTCNYYGFRNAANDAYQHSLGIDQKWGQGTASHLNILSKKYKQFSAQEMESLIEAVKGGYEEYCRVYAIVCPE